MQTLRFKNTSQSNKTCRALHGINLNPICMLIQDQNIKQEVEIDKKLINV